MNPLGLSALSEMPTCCIFRLVSGVVKWVSRSLPAASASLLRLDFSCVDTVRKNDRTPWCISGLFLATCSPCMFRLMKVLYRCLSLLRASSLVPGRNRTRLVT